MAKSFQTLLDTLSCHEKIYINNTCLVDNHVVPTLTKFSDPRGSDIECVRLNMTESDSNSYKSFSVMVGNHPIVVCENMANDLNLEVFETSSLAVVEDIRFLPRHQISGPTLSKIQDNTWTKPSKIGSKMMTLSKYAEYQKNEVNEGSDIHFASNIDLGPKFKEQHHELTKLPTWMQPRGDNNILSHLKYDIQGVNTIQMFLKVKGCATPIHTENSWLLSINVNTGPGDCRWFAFHREYIPKFESLARTKGIANFSEVERNPYFPLKEELIKNGIPTYEFVQRKGETVVVMEGTPHWVESLSTTNNVAWNIGPVTERQLNCCFEKRMINLESKYPILVPIKFLTWMLAENEVLREEMKGVIVNVIRGSVARGVTILTCLHALKLNNNIHEMNLTEFAQLRCSICLDELEWVGFKNRRSSTTNYICFSCWRNNTKLWSNNKTIVLTSLWPSVKFILAKLAQPVEQFYDPNSNMNRLKECETEIDALMKINSDLTRRLGLLEGQISEQNSNDETKDHKFITWKCEHPECLKTFIWKRARFVYGKKSHMATHAQETYDCPQCNETYKTLGRLNVHIKRKH